MCGKGEVEDADTATQNQKDGEDNKYGKSLSHVITLCWVM